MGKMVKIRSRWPAGYPSFLLLLTTRTAFATQPSNKASSYHLSSIIRNPETEVTELSYSFSPDTLSDKDAREMNVASGSRVLICNGIFFSAAYALPNTPVMVSRLYILPQIVEIRYAFSKAKGGWEVFPKK